MSVLSGIRGSARGSVAIATTKLVNDFFFFHLGQSQFLPISHALSRVLEGKLGQYPGCLVLRSLWCLYVAATRLAVP